MSDSDDDYMSFMVLVDSKDDVRPSLLFNREKRKMNVFKKKLEPSTKRKKSLHELERQTRERGLNTAISNENKGFQLLAKMGFRQGERLGKSKTGIKEPIGVIVKQGTSGIGRESHLKDIFNKKQQQKLKHLKHFENRFRLTFKERINLDKVRKDLLNAQRICEELDFRLKIKDPVEEFFWTKETIKKRRKMENNKVLDDTDSSSDDENFETYITEENLFTLIEYLRSKHLYCIYCAITGIGIKDLEDNCPGPYRMDHDDE
ncbi:G patch domain-containing protein 11-like [Diabrotica virgifera virgifera]|uniref:G patch domain-containing protein 11 n=1 Tax=Diabrotica virgifera virgifera TaxID=50390 RepID=A0A6P7GPR6_DIAVI|nr:G patch domain-containing protein 11-like [Diabrotica virgifera virgifera]